MLMRGGGKGVIGERLVFAGSSIVRLRTFLCICRNKSSHFSSPSLPLLCSLLVGLVFFRGPCSIPYFRISQSLLLLHFLYSSWSFSLFFVCASSVLFFFTKYIFFCLIVVPFPLLSQSGEPRHYLQS